MLRIGFIDHHLNNYHANKFLSLLHGPLASLDARVVTAWESDPTGEDWCAANNIPRAASAEAAAGECDAVIVLAPDNIETHRELCGLVFPAGKPVMVDKFLAPSCAEAEGIVQLAETHGVRLFSASSLRFAREVQTALEEAAGPASEAWARGMGEWDGYGVHTLSMAFAVLGADVARVIDTGAVGSDCVTLEYAGGARAWIDVRAAPNQWEAFPWSFGFRTPEKYVTGTVQDFDGFYTELMRQAVRFFTTGASDVSVGEMLRVVAVLEAANRSREQGGVWIDL